MLLRSTYFSFAAIFAFLVVHTWGNDCYAERNHLRKRQQVSLHVNQLTKAEKMAMQDIMLAIEQCAQKKVPKVEENCLEVMEKVAAQNDETLKFDSKQCLQLFFIDQKIRCSQRIVRQVPLKFQSYWNQLFGEQIRQTKLLIKQELKKLNLNVSEWLTEFANR